MKAVFLGGSRRLSRLNTAIRDRLDKIMARGLTIYIGDANGADKAMQRYLADAHYSRVIVFAVSAHLRNNLGNWEVQLVTPPSRAKGAEIFAAKDRVMGERATAGLMLWDGKSRGTLANIHALLADGKPVALYYAPKRRFLSLRTCDDLRRRFPVARTGSRPRAARVQHALALDHGRPGNAA